MPFFHSRRCGALYLSKAEKRIIQKLFVYNSGHWGNDVPVVIRYISFGKQRFLIAQHPIDIDDGALFIEHGRTCDIVIVECPNAFGEFIAHVRES